jgi:LacI family xylobiose transport system transcriptional regulator
MPSTSRSPAAGKEPLTIAEIAELTGVSVATVSKVVNGRSDVAAATRGLIESVITEHGYRRKRRPPAPAPLIELVFNVLGGEYAMEIIAGVERIARRHHMGVVVSGLQWRDTPEAAWMGDMLTRRPTGLITVTCSPSETQRQQLRTRGIPFVVVDPVAEPAQVPSVGATNWTGGVEATRHLLELGHRRIGIIGGPPQALHSRARLDGFRAALDAAGVAADPELIRFGEFRIDDGVVHTRAMLALPDPPTAVFACSDAYAVGAYQAAHELGIRIPDQLSVVGFDDIPPVTWLTPPLTTVRQPLTGMAEEAAAMVISLARGEPLPRTRVVLATDLLVRGSTGPPPR